MRLNRWIPMRKVVIYHGSGLASWLSSENMDLHTVVEVVLPPLGFESVREPSQADVELNQAMLLKPRLFARLSSVCSHKPKPAGGLAQELAQAKRSTVADRLTPSLATRATELMLGFACRSM